MRLAAAGPICLFAAIPPALASTSAAPASQHFADLKMDQHVPAVLNDFCAYGPRLNIKTDAPVPAPANGGIRLMVTRVAKGVAVTIYPDDTIKTAHDAADLIPALFASARESCRDPIDTWQVLTTNVEGLHVEAPNGQVHFSFQGQDR